MSPCLTSYNHLRSKRAVKLWKHLMQIWCFQQQVKMEASIKSESDSQEIDFTMMMSWILISVGQASKNFLRMTMCIPTAWNALIVQNHIFWPFFLPFLTHFWPWFLIPQTQMAHIKNWPKGVWLSKGVPLRPKNVFHALQRFHPPAWTHKRFICMKRILTLTHGQH